jgi:hypothetical protein
MLCFVNSCSAVFYDISIETFCKFGLQKFDIDLIFFLTFYDFRRENIENVFRVIISVINVAIPGLNLKRSFKILKYLLSTTNSAYPRNSSLSHMAIFVSCARNYYSFGSDSQNENEVKISLLITKKNLIRTGSVHRNKQNVCPALTFLFLQ